MNPKKFFLLHVHNLLSTHFLNPQSRASLGQHNLKKRKKSLISRREPLTSIVAVADRALKERVYVIHGYV